MASKIILSLSNLRDNAPSYSYLCPDKSTQKGSQTNVAPVKYLLKAHPRIRQVLCLVTPTAKKNALPHFQSEIRKFAPLAEIVCIDAPDTGKLPETVIASLIQGMQPGDTVYMDSSGGTRYTVMGLLQIVRILEFKGINLGQVVYANISAGQRHTIDDVTELYQRLDLIGGMHELADFGSVQTLRNYFRKDPSPDGAVILNLLKAIEDMTNAIILCRTQTLKNAVETYKEKMLQAQAVRDPIMRELIEILRQKFGDRLDTPWLIEWCLDHNMLPQALSLYREWMPEYILRQSGLFTVIPDLPKDAQKNDHQDLHVALWGWMMNLALPAGTQPNMYYTAETIKNIDRLLPRFGWTVTDPGKVQRIAWDFQYIQAIRNMVLHSNETASIGIDMRKALTSEGYDLDFEKMSVSDITQKVRKALKNAKN